MHLRRAGRGAATAALMALLLLSCASVQSIVMQAATAGGARRLVRRRDGHGPAPASSDVTAAMVMSAAQMGAMAMASASKASPRTDQPECAVQEGLIGSFGTLDPSDGARSERFSLSGRYATKGEAWTFDAQRLPHQELDDSMERLHPRFR